MVNKWFIVITLWCHQLHGSGKSPMNGEVHCGRIFVRKIRGSRQGSAADFPERNTGDDGIELIIILNYIVANIWGYRSNKIVQYTSKCPSNDVRYRGTQCSSSTIWMIWSFDKSGDFDDSQDLKPSKHPGVP